MEGELIKFKQVIVLGSGKIAVECLKILSCFLKEIVTIEQEEQPLSFVRLLSEKYGFPYHLMSNKEELLTYLWAVEKKTLVVSVNNNYIFPQEILTKNNLSIINFHNALLPNYPGRNAPTWVIFNEEKTTGVTWHMVENGVDTGKILMQQIIVVDPLMTALELTKQCMKVGIELFHKLVPEVLADRFVCHGQDRRLRRNFHTAQEIPNHGCMEMAWPAAKVSAFLRSLDYGRINLFPPPKIVLLGQEYFIRKYGILSAPTPGYQMNFQENEIMLQDYGQIIRIMLERGERDGGSKEFATGN